MTERVPSIPTPSIETTSATPAVSSDPAAARQRHALAYLSKFEYPVELGTLAAYIAAKVEQVPVECVPDRAREEVAVALHHVDLPRLVAARAVRYDPESRMVVLADLHGVERYADAINGFRSTDPV